MEKEKQLIQPPKGVGEEETLSPEKKLRRERTRQLHTGITLFELVSNKDVPIGNDLFRMPGLGNPFFKLPLHDVDSTLGPVLDPRISSNGLLVVFVCDKKLYTCTVMANDNTGETTSTMPKQLTHNARGLVCTNGLADFIVMEEMDRYQGFWIPPDSENPNVAFEQSDKSHIDKFQILHSGQAIPLKQEYHHYLFSGDANPLVDWE